LSLTTTELRVEFFDWLYGDSEGYVCLATAEAENARRTFKQKFFHWPSQKEQVNTYCNEFSTNKNLWFCVNLLSQPDRKKEYCLSQNVVWADLDTCNPELVNPKPSLIIISSPNRYQALWKMDQDVPATVAEDYSKRIAYKYKQDGADPSGWDLTQLLRVPFTANLKYAEKPLVLLSAGNTYDIPVTDFEEVELAPVPELGADEDAIVPTDIPDVKSVIYSYQSYLDRSFYELYEIEPTSDNDWSARMWKLINLAFEAGMREDEVYAVALSAKCNKYIREFRPMRFLWVEILKAKQLQEKIDHVAGEWQPLLMPELVDADSCSHDTFIDRYHDWATGTTDAVPVFHELAGAIILSTILSGSIRLDVSHTYYVPNLWGLILGESTLTRKTTAMMLAMSILRDVDPEAQFANEGTAEGLLTGLSNRPGKPSVFYKDEVSGFFDAINNKSYLAGIPEILTNLYDCPPYYSRYLRKEEIIVRNPILIFFGGGITEKTYSHLSESYVLSGFLPRFLVVGGVTDLSKLRHIGPGTPENLLGREKLVTELLDLREIYSPPQSYMMVAGQKVSTSTLSDQPAINALLTPDAWEMYNSIADKMLKTAYESNYKDLALPTFERLSRSMLKLSILIAAARQEPVQSAFDVHVDDVKNAARFIQKWGRYSIDLILNAGKTESLRLMEKIRTSISNKPGIYKSELMRIHHLNSQEVVNVIMTLVDRGEIIRKPSPKSRRSEQYWIVH
jgi:hypothetical protein